MSHCHTVAYTYTHACTYTHTQNTNKQQNTKSTFQEFVQVVQQQARFNVKIRF